MWWMIIKLFFFKTRLKVIYKQLYRVYFTLQETLEDDEITKTCPLEVTIVQRFNEIHSAIKIHSTTTSPKIHNFAPFRLCETCYWHQIQNQH